MRKIIAIIISIVAMILAACEDSDAQDLALRSSVKMPELRIEAGATLVAEQDFLFGLDVRGWVSAGTVIEDGRIVGSGSALVKFFDKGRVFAETGPAYSGWILDDNYSSLWDWVVQASIRLEPASSLSFGVSPKGALALAWSKRF